MSDTIKVFLTDDHAVVRTGLSALLEVEADLELVGEATNGLEAVEKIEELNPDVILMDIMMPQMNGIEAIQHIMTKNPDAHVLVLTSFAEEENVIPAIKNGALGYILKDSSPEELVQAIRDVHQGKATLHPSIARILMKDLHQDKSETPLDDPLTDREKEVLILVAQGKSNQEISEALVISNATVRFHITNILSKLHLENRTQAALYAIREGLVTL